MKRKIEKFGYPCTHQTILGHNAWRFDFNNGYGASVIGGHGCYGDGITTFELAVLKKGEINYKTPTASDVLGWLSVEEVIKTLKEISELKGAKK